MKKLIVISSILLLSACAKDKATQPTASAPITHSNKIDTTYCLTNACNWRYNSLQGSEWCQTGAQEGYWYYQLPTINDSILLSCVVVDSLSKHSDTIYNMPIFYKPISAYDWLDYGITNNNIYLTALLRPGSTSIPANIWIRIVYYTHI